MVVVNLHCHNGVTKQSDGYSSERKYTLMRKNQTTQLYHCTNHFALCEILKSKQFNPSFCLEELSIYANEPLKMAYAVVCFADLLKQELRTHMANFHSDCYIIMDKEWAKRERVSPVIYYTDNSLMTFVLKNIVEYATITNKDENEENLKFFNSVCLFMGYLKQYEGRYLIKAKNTFSDVTQFYKEREWRYLPIPLNYEANYISEEDYKNEKLRKEKTQELIAHGYVLRFELKDIIEIGIPRSIKKKFIDIIRKSFGKEEQEEITQKIRFLNNYIERIKAFTLFHR